MDSFVKGILESFIFVTPYFSIVTNSLKINEKWAIHLQKGNNKIKGKIDIDVNLNIIDDDNSCYLLFFIYNTGTTDFKNIFGNDTHDIIDYIKSAKINITHKCDHVYKCDEVEEYKIECISVKHNFTYEIFNNIINNLEHNIISDSYYLNKKHGLFAENMISDPKLIVNFIKINKKRDPDYYKNYGDIEYINNDISNNNTLIMYL